LDFDVIMVGRAGSGKTLAAKALVNLGFRHVYLSSFLKDNFARRHPSEIPTRDMLSKFAQRRRGAFGADYLVVRSLAHIPHDQRIVFDGIRLQCEIIAIKKWASANNRSLTTIWVQTCEYVRFCRHLSSVAPKSKHTLRSFSAESQREDGIPFVRLKPEIRYCRKHAEVCITNNIGQAVFLDKVVTCVTRQRALA
jgi:hypothetical protein